MHSMAQTVRTASAHEQTRIIVLVDNSARFDTCLIIAKQEGMVQRARMPLADRTIHSPAKVCTWHLPAWIVVTRHCNVLPCKERLQNTSVVPCAVVQQDPRTCDAVMPFCGATGDLRGVQKQRQFWCSHGQKDASCIGIRASADTSRQHVVENSFPDIVVLRTCVRAAPVWRNPLRCPDLLHGVLGAAPSYFRWLCISQHAPCLQTFGKHPTAPPTCGQPCYQRASESASSTVGFQSNRRPGSVLQLKLQRRAGPPHTQFLALCGPYSSINAGVVPRDSFTGVTRAAHRPPCPRPPFWPTKPPARSTSSLTTRMNFCRGV
jgi:hypothetical protein